MSALLVENIKNSFEWQDHVLRGPSCAGENYWTSFPVFAFSFNIFKFVSILTNTSGTETIAHHASKTLLGLLTCSKSFSPWANDGMQKVVGFQLLVL